MLLKYQSLMKLALTANPTNALAVGRSILANERTLLAFLRTGLGLLAGGIGIVGLVNHPLIVLFGWLAIVLSIPLLVWGILRYRVINKVLTEIIAEDLTPTE